MRGYPKHIATEQDYRNLLSMPEYRERALADLQALAELDDDKVTVCTDRKNRDIHAERKTEEKSNRTPVWQRKGFSSRHAIDTLVKSVAKER
jgi:anti-sigma-K factor RskA